MSTLPLPVRVAVGLMVTAVEQARKFPEQLAEFPVTAASRAVQAGMRVQQRVTELAIKGDEVFSLFRPLQDSPSWARFDEDDELDQQATSVIEGTAAACGFDDFDEIDPGEADETGETGTDNTGGDAIRSGVPAPALPGYEDMSLPQLRGKLRALSLVQLAELLEYEHANQDRAPYVTMLSNRITSVRSQ